MVKGGDGGAEEDRTPDLCIANAALSQLSYGPIFATSSIVTHLAQHSPVRKPLAGFGCRRQTVWRTGINALRYLQGILTSHLNGSGVHGMLETASSTLRLWGHGIGLQAISLTRQGLVIRNGDQQLLIPREDIRHFQEQLTCLMAENDGEAGKPSVARGV